MQFIYYGDTLQHHGIKGQKWGVRRYQNADGSLTSKGRAHYDVGEKISSKYIRDTHRLSNGKKMSRKTAKATAKYIEKMKESFDIDSIKAQSVSQLRNNADESFKKLIAFEKDSNSGKCNDMDADEWQEERDGLRYDSYRTNMSLAIKTGNFQDYINNSRLGKTSINKIHATQATKATVASCLFVLGGATIAGVAKGLLARR